MAKHNHTLRWAVIIALSIILFAFAVGKITEQSTPTPSEQIVPPSGCAGGWECTKMCAGLTGCCQCTLTNPGSPADPNLAGGGCRDRWACTSYCSGGQCCQCTFGVRPVAG